MIIFVGIAMFFMEVSLGQFSGQSSVQAFTCVPLFRGKFYSLLNHKLQVFMILVF